MFIDKTHLVTPIGIPPHLKSAITIGNVCYTLANTLYIYACVCVSIRLPHSGRVRMFIFGICGVRQSGLAPRQMFLRRPWRQGRGGVTGRYWAGQMSGIRCRGFGEEE